MMSVRTPTLSSRTGCRCGHDHAAHEHYRRGSDCALCAGHLVDCAVFRPTRPYVEVLVNVVREALRLGLHPHQT